MRGDTGYANQHQHGVKESAQPASGNHLMLRNKPTEPKEIRRASPSFRGHMLLTFVDGTAYELQHGDYPHNALPKAGDFFPPLQEGAEVVANEVAEPVKAKRKKKSAAEPPADNA